MEILAVNKVNDILNRLDKARVEYLQFDAYNEEDYSEKYQQEYIELFKEIVVNRIFKHFGIDSQDDEISVNYFAKENGKWLVSFYEPEVDTTIDKILNNDYSDLKYKVIW